MQPIEIYNKALDDLKSVEEGLKTRITTSGQVESIVLMDLLARCVTLHRDVNHLAHSVAMDQE